MSNRTFVAGLTVCLGLMVAMFGVLYLLNRGHNRPEGVAEDWLAALSDTTREGVEADGRERAEKIGPVALASDFVQPNPERKAAFPDLEVGKAEVDPTSGLAKVPFKLRTRVGEDAEEKSGLIVMREAGESWRVTEVQLLPLEQVPPLPSAGGPPPSAAPWSLWIGALLGAGVIGVITSALVRAAERSTAAAATT